MPAFKLTTDQQSLLKTNKQLRNKSKIIEKIVRSDNFFDQEQNVMRSFLLAADLLYRHGMAIISDAQYDEQLHWYEENYPNNHIADFVQPDFSLTDHKIALPQKMLSTNKAYSKREIEKWLDQIINAALALNINLSTVKIKATPKLDGYAAFDDGVRLYTRGDGIKGQDITRAFNRGLQIATNGKRGLGAGEIVIDKNYFQRRLSEFFENSRNIQAAIIAEKNVDEKIQIAIDDGACVFYPFALLNNWIGHYQELLDNFEDIVSQVWDMTKYDLDGIVLEAVDPQIKEKLGSNRKFHRWQIAFKINEEAANVEVLQVIAQTSRMGRITPVANLVPTKISGVIISRVTVHHYNMVKINGIGKGAIVQVVRSGLVIPKIEKVIKSVEPDLPQLCPSCQSTLIWEADHLICLNKNDCHAQTENTLVHFFAALGNNKGFGPNIINKLTSFGIKHIHEIYALQEQDFIGYGFGEKTAQNLFNQLQASREIAIEDWRFLAAFGISRLGEGNCEKLLRHHILASIFTLSVDDVIKIDGFAQISAEVIIAGLANIKDEFFKVYELNFNLLASTQKDTVAQFNSPISGATIVFTGTMLKNKRNDMEKQAKLLGAKVASSVTNKTTYLVAGSKVGQTKINDAKAKNVTVLLEDDYYSLLDQVNK